MLVTYHDMLQHIQHTSRQNAWANRAKMLPIWVGHISIQSTALRPFSKTIISPDRKVQMTNGLMRWKLDSKTFDSVGNAPCNSSYIGGYVRLKSDHVRDCLKQSAVMQPSTWTFVLRLPSTSNFPPILQMLSYNGSLIWLPIYGLILTVSHHFIDG